MAEREGITEKFKNISDYDCYIDFRCSCCSDQVHLDGDFRITDLEAIIEEMKARKENEQIMQQELDKQNQVVGKRTFIGKE